MVPLPRISSSCMATPAHSLPSPLHCVLKCWYSPGLRPGPHSLITLLFSRGRATQSHGFHSVHLLCPHLFSHSSFPLGPIHLHASSYWPHLPTWIHTGSLGHTGSKRPRQDINVSRSALRACILNHSWTRIHADGYKFSKGKRMSLSKICPVG